MIWFCRTAQEFPAVGILALGLLVGVACSHNMVQAQGRRAAIELQWEALDAGTDASFRGLAVVDNNTLWVSGSRGTVLRSTDAGRTFEDVSVPRAEDLDFRDIHAFDANTAVVMNAGTPGRFFKTSNGGKSWRRVYDDRRPEVFFDALDFWGEQQNQGIAFGDAIGGRLLLIRTTDAGQSWRELDRELQPEMLAGEGGFAASGTCLVASRNGPARVWIGTGSHLQDRRSPESRVLRSSDGGETWTAADVPLARTPSSGVFGICHIQGHQLMAVGGDYLNPDGTSSNFAVSSDDGKSWQTPADAETNAPSGFRSVAIAVDFDGRLVVVAAGTNGADTWDVADGVWTRSTDHSLNVLAAAGSETTPVIFGAGPKGVIVRARIGK